MFFRKSQSGAGKTTGKGKSKGAGTGTGKRAGKTTGKGTSKGAGKTTGKGTSKGTGKRAGKGTARRRLDSALPGIQRPARGAAPAWQPRQGARRGAPLAPETQWLLGRMSMLTNLDDAIVFKQTYIELYRRNPLHNPFSAERAFYHALQVCRRRLLAEDE